MAGSTLTLRNTQTGRILLAVTVLASTVCAAGQEPAGQSKPIQVQGCFLRLKEQAEVPARDSGVLQVFEVDLGDAVNAGDLLVTLDEKEAQYAVQLAEIDYRIASKKATESVGVEIAEAAMQESDQLIEQAQVELQVAQKMAASDVAVRISQAAESLATDELSRTLDSQREFSGSVSELEVIRKRHAVNKSRLDVEQAQHELSLQSLKMTGRRAYLEQNTIAGTRLKLERQDATTAHGISILTASRADAALNVAREKLDRRRIVSPLSGIVVERLKHQGEWVEAGQPVLRLIQLDRLYVEGYVKTDQIELTDRGRPVSVTTASPDGELIARGRIVFVSPEVDSVNGQVLIKAEVSNPKLLLRPGKRVDMTIEVNTGDRLGSS